jgi:hypothetical protein
MPKVILITLAIVSLVLIMSVEARSQPIPELSNGMCKKTNKMISHLEGRYDEKKVMSGLDTDGVLLEVYMAENSWTVLRTFSTGYSCILLVGEFGMLENNKGPAY